MLIGLTKKMENDRAPLSERKGLPSNAFWELNIKNLGKEMMWLYSIDTEEEVSRIFSSF